MNLKNLLTLHNTFRVGVILKGLNALIEIIGGFLILFLTQEQILKTVLRLTQEELIEDPKDFITNSLLHLAGNLSINSQIFFSLYLLSHGIIKIFLVASLLKGKTWSYPIAIVFFTIFIIYQIYRYLINYSLGLLFLTILDVFILLLTILEYRRLKASYLK